MSRILVTGAAGCVGSNLVRKLAKQGHEINILIKPNTWHPFLEGLKLNVFRGDVRDLANVKNAMNGCEYVYSIAGVVSYNRIDNKDMFTTHVHGTRNILTAAKELKVKKVVVTASTAGVGIPKNKNMPLNEDALFDLSKFGNNMYMFSKYACIKECQKAAEEGLNVSIISPSTIYGQGDTSMHIGKIVKKIKEGKIRLLLPEEMQLYLLMTLLTLTSS